MATEPPGTDPTISTGVGSLPDGRQIAYRWFGADPESDGPVVVHNHGGLSSSLDAAPAHAPAEALGVRLLVPDRPGVGGSSRHAGRTTADWVPDMTTLLDQLGIDRCSATGWSMGGQYAMAMAAGLPERVARVAILAGCPPLTDPDTLAQLNRLDRTLLRMSQNHPRRAVRAFGLLHRLDNRSATRLAHRPARHDRRPGAMARTWGPADAAVLAGPFGAVLSQASADGLADAEGQIDEYLAFGGPWGFDPSSIPVPLRVWQGDADRFVPEEWANEIAALVADGSVQSCPGQGHLACVERWPEVLAWLTS